MPGSKSVLIVSPDRSLVAALQRAVRKIHGAGAPACLAEYPEAAKLWATLAEHKPALVVIGLSDPERALPLLETIRGRRPDLPVAVANAAAAPELVMKAYRAGACDFLSPPFEVGALEPLLRLQPKPAPYGTGPLGKLLCFLPARGGCGGTVVSLHSAAALAKTAAERVLLVDFDWQGSVGFHLRMQPKFTLCDALHRAAELDELWERLVHRWGALDVLAPPPARSAITPALLERAPALFQSARKSYRWVVCDLPPAVYPSALDPIAQAEAVYLVCTPEPAALQQARRRLQELNEAGLPPEAVRLIINRWRSGTGLRVAEVESLVGIPLACTLPNDYAGVSRAILEGRLVSPESELGRQFQFFARQILGAPVPDEPSGPGASWRRFLMRLGRGEEADAQGRDQGPKAVGPGSQALKSGP